MVRCRPPLEKKHEKWKWGRIPVVVGARVRIRSTE